MTIHGYLNGPRFITALIVGEGPPKQLFILFILFLFILSYFIVFSISLCHCLTVEASLRRRIHDLNIATCIERFYRFSLRVIGLSWTNKQMFSHLRILTPILLFFKLKCRVISNQHKWCLYREHAQSRSHTTISWPGEEIYWHSAAQLKCH